MNSNIRSISNALWSVSETQYDAGWSSGIAHERLNHRGLDSEQSRIWRTLQQREAFAETVIKNADGEPWRVRGYQRGSLESWAPRKVHCDGRDVGKTTEIELVAAWASVVERNRQMLIATQCENHLFPLMHRIVRRIHDTPQLASNLVEFRRSPSWYLRFRNGFQLWGRLSGPRGVNFQGLHVDWQIVDEAQEMTDAAWGEILQALNAGGLRWVYGVPNGLRNTFYRMTQDTSYEHHNWPSSVHPDYDDVKDAELARLYGGRDAPGYIHRVLGQHGAPEHAVFRLDDYLACVDESIARGCIVLQEGDAFEAPSNIVDGDYYLGCDLGYARDPSEFVIYRSESPHLIHTLRVHLRGVNYARQQAVIEAMDDAYDFRGIGIDAGNNGRAVAHNLMALGESWCEKVRAFEFGATVELEPLPDGQPHRRPAKQFMTELLERRLAERTIVLPRDPEREGQYASQTYSIGLTGRVQYSKGNDHIIDADRCVVLRHHLDCVEYDMHYGLDPRMEGFRIDTG